MKSLLLGILVAAVVVVCFGQTVDTPPRSDVVPIMKMTTATLTWASGETGALTTTLANVNGLLGRIDVVASNSTNAITYTIAVADQNSATVVSAIASIPENATTVENAYDTSSPPFEPIIVANDTLTITVTPSGDPGASGATVYLIFRLK